MNILFDLYTTQHFIGGGAEYIRKVFYSVLDAIDGKNDIKIFGLHSSKLNKYAYAYYVLDKPTISDGEYDKLYDKLSTMEKETGVTLPNSPTQRVGDVVLENFQKVEHKIRLYSLDKCQSLHELNSWVDSVQQK